MSPLLDLRGLRKVYRRPFSRVSTVAVDGVDLRVSPGEVVGLIGESGCGKTSLARTALGLLRRDAGEVRVLGQDPHVLRGEALRALRRRAQLLLQDPGASLNPGLTVRETLEESRRAHRPDDAAIVDEALARVDLAHRAKARPHELSGGEKRRATLAQLWIADPFLTVADEPTAGLDAARKAELLDLLLARRGPDRAFVLISHDLPLVLYACTRVVVMDRGRVVDDFDPRALAPASLSDATRRLLEASGMAS
ncbi:MAG: ATP-binding cassette domain-containing protein [Myxococcota bacterium]